MYTFLIGGHLGVAYVVTEMQFFAKMREFGQFFLHFPLPSGLQSNIFGYSKIIYLLRD